MIRKGKTSADLRDHSIDNNGGRSCKKHEDPSQGMYEEVDDSVQSSRFSTKDKDSHIILFKIKDKKLHFTNLTSLIGKKKYSFIGNAQIYVLIIITFFRNGKLIKKRILF